MKPFAKKSLGQNFLVDNNYIEKIIDELSLTAEDQVIEIGPGRGALTEKLVESGAAVTAIEVDKDLIPVLQEQFSGSENFYLVNEDALQADFGKILDSSFEKSSSQLIVHSAKLVANLPYYISTAILQRLIEQRQCFSELVLMLQREVVDRITAEPGNSERGFLTVLAEAYMQAEHLFDVPPNAFRPAPKIWSAVVRLTPKKDPGIADEKLFREIIAAGFAYKRKTILNNFKNTPPKLKEKFSDAQKLLEDNEIDPQRRAETLTIIEWKRLNDALISDGK
jgi:16S rRNA (adenine1518-N6/adenine1519-N6)-dimethyltransferase